MKTKKPKAILSIDSRPTLKRVRVFVGVSGGVDSSVALKLLQNATPNNFQKLFGRPTPKGFRGYDVIGVFLKVWHPEFLPCDWREERRSAMRVCATLGVPFMTIDCEAEYKKEVVDYMIAEYRAGRTPNPDVFCNKYVKFGVFLRKALEMGADYVATGHYARKETEEKTLQYELYEALDENKDQSYFLYTLGQHELSHTLFPIGGMTKPEVRKLAEKFGLSTATKKDSQGVCFLENIDMKEFLSHYIETKKGDVLNINGEVIGFHDGAVLYTIGERHGFTITKKTSSDPRYFVVSKDLEKNTITVANKDAEKNVVFSTREIIINELHLISNVQIEFPLNVQTRIRYRQEKQKCIVTKQSDGYHVVFNEPQNGVASGQSAVLYSGSLCLGGGIIDRVQ